MVLNGLKRYDTIKKNYEIVRIGLKQSKMIKNSLTSNQTIENWF